MHSFKLVAAATFMLSAVGLAQNNDAKLGQKTKAWLVGNLDHLVIKGVAVQGGRTYLNVQGSADIDEDGVPDGGIVRLQCTGGELRAAHYNATSPRGSAGQSSGKRTHHPVTFVKKWSATTPQLYQVTVTSIGSPKITPKIAKESHGRSAASGWEPITLADSATICAAVEDVRLESR